MTNEEFLTVIDGVKQTDVADKYPIYTKEDKSFDWRSLLFTIGVGLIIFLVLRRK